MDKPKDANPAGLLNPNISIIIDIKNITLIIVSTEDEPAEPFIFLNTAKHNINEASAHSLKLKFC